MDISPTRLHSLSQHFRNRSSSLESQGKLLASDPDAHPHTLGSPDFFLGPGRSSNGSDPLDDCSSCTSQSSSEHYYPSGGPPGSNPNYSTLGEDSPSKARQRQRQRHRCVCVGVSLCVCVCVCVKEIIKTSFFAFSPAGLQVTWVPLTLAQCQIWQLRMVLVEA